MPVTPTYPGVYIQEVPSGVRTIVGAPTSIGLFIGAANGGPVNQPVLCLSYTDFLREFGSASATTNLGRYLKLFFMNGGSQCHVMRIAQGAASAEITLQSEAGVDALTLTAKQQGQAGNMIRAEVTYATARPESTFNIDIFRWVVTATGTVTKTDVESYKNLTMDPDSSSYAVDFITQNSKLVNASIPASIGVPPAPGTAFSQAGRIVEHLATAADVETQISALMGSTGPAAQTFEISVGGSPFVSVNLLGWVTPTGAASVAASRTDLANSLDLFLNGALLAAGVTRTVATTFQDGPTVDLTTVLRISSAPVGTVGNEVIIRGGTTGLAPAMMLGMDYGGLEVGPFAAARPAPTGTTFQAVDASLMTFAGAVQSSIAELDVTVGATTTAIPLQGADTLVTTTSGAPMYEDNIAGSLNNNNDGIREKFGIIRDAVNAFAAADPTFQFKAELWGNYRLALSSTAAPTTSSTAPGNDNEEAGLLTHDGAFAGTDIGGDFNINVRYYSLGTTGAGTFQTGGVPGFDGNPPTDVEYAAAYAVADQDIDIFNLMVLPPDVDTTTGITMDQIYAEASVFCKKRRAFLVMDPPSVWSGLQQKADVVPLRIGLEKDFSALYYPRLIVNESGREVPVGPSGAIAGLYGRIDGTRGVWKAPAGTEATLKGVRGVTEQFTDDQNGVMNPRAINIIRAFPEGIVSWGARTMDGDDEFGSEYKYVPIRRLALFIEETLYRNLKWVVFEPNDEPLWAQIRLNVGAFMQGLFRKGAFEGKTPKDAYFVRCDGDTTTPTDRNLGIVNIWVGFAPLKPAEFVIIYIQQKTAQAEV